MPRRWTSEADLGEVSRPMFIACRATAVHAAMIDW